MNKQETKVYVLSYGSCDTDEELYVETLGVFSTFEDAKKTMERNINEDIADGYGDKFGHWKRDENSAYFFSDFSEKMYRIEEKKILSL